LCMLDVPHFIAPMMIRFGNATVPAYRPFVRISALGISRSRRRPLRCGRMACYARTGGE